LETLFNQAFRVNRAIRIRSSDFVLASDVGPRAEEKSFDLRIWAFLRMPFSLIF